MSGRSKKLFEMYYLEFRDVIYWYVYRKINKKDIAEDITADVFMKLLENEKVMQERDKNGVRAWLYTVARNQMIDMFRKGSKKKNVDLDEEVFEIIASKDDDQIKVLMKDEESEMLVAMLDSLDPEEKEIIHLRFYEEMKYSEIGKIVNKNEGAVKMSLYRALEKVKVKAGDRLDLFKN